MLNQTQYHQAFVENKTGEEIGGFKGILFLELHQRCTRTFKCIVAIELPK